MTLQDEIFEKHGLSVKHLDEGNHKIKCPQCQPPHDSSDRPMSVEISNDKIVFFCHHCEHKGGVLSDAEYAAAILRPYVSEKTYWILLKHGEFQMYYYAHHLGADRNKRDQYKNHKYYDDCVKFCELWDQSSFDPNYKSLKLEEFEPIIRRIFSKKPYSS